MVLDMHTALFRTFCVIILVLDNTTVCPGLMSLCRGGLGLTFWVAVTTFVLVGLEHCLTVRSCISNCHACWAKAGVPGWRIGVGGLACSIVISQSSDGGQIAAVALANLFVGLSNSRSGLIWPQSSTAPQLVTVCALPTDYIP